MINYSEIKRLKRNLKNIERKLAIIKKGITEYENNQTIKTYLQLKEKYDYLIYQCDKINSQIDILND